MRAAAAQGLTMPLAAVLLLSAATLVSTDRGHFLLSLWALLLLDVLVISFFVGFVTAWSPGHFFLCGLCYCLACRPGRFFLCGLSVTACRPGHFFFCGLCCCLSFWSLLSVWAFSLLVVLVTSFFVGFFLACRPGHFFLCGLFLLVVLVISFCVGFFLACRPGHFFLCRLCYCLSSWSFLSVWALFFLVVLVIFISLWALFLL